MYTRPVISPGHTRVSRMPIDDVTEMSKVRIFRLFLCVASTLESSETCVLRYVWQESKLEPVVGAFPYPHGTVEETSFIRHRHIATIAPLAESSEKAIPTGLNCQLF